MQGIPAHLEHMAQAPAPAAQPPPAAALAEPAAPAAAPAQAADPAQPAQPAQPQNLFQLAQQRQQQGQQPGTGGGLPGLGAGGAGNLGSLAEHPQLQHLRNVMAQNPQLAQPIIQELAAQNPGLAQLLGQNPEMLAHLLNSALEAEGEEGGPLPPGTHVVQVTEEERAAIERVRGLVFCYTRCLDCRLIARRSWRHLGFRDRR